ncbi:hypothetical protein DSM100688_0798 [Bifidobacterium ramosum]|nr:hypothetical protein DSM100688_0798 [Bifidobacterium ramosum]
MATGPMPRPRPCSGIVRARMSAARLAADIVDGMRPAGWLLACIGLAGTACYPITGWRETLSSGICALAVAIMAMVCSRSRPRGTASVAISRRQANIGERIDITVTVSPRGRSTIGGTTCAIMIDDSREALTLPSMQAGGAATFALSCVASARTVLMIGPVMIGTGDPLGFCTHEHVLAEPQPVYVHPSVVPLRSRRCGASYGTEGVADGTMADDDFDFHGLRDYVPGDDLRQVHWPSSSRTGTLMIRQYEAVRHMHTGLAIDLDPQGYAGRQEFELAISCYASIGAHCLRIRQSLVAYAGDRRIDAPHTTALLNACSAIEPLAPSGDGMSYAIHALSRVQCSCRIFIVGSAWDIAGASPLTQSTAHDGVLIAIRVEDGAAWNVRRIGRMVSVTMGALDDLPLVWEVISWR